MFVMPGLAADSVHGALELVNSTIKRCFGRVVKAYDCYSYGFARTSSNLVGIDFPRFIKQVEEFFFCHFFFFNFIYAKHEREGALNS